LRHRRPRCVERAYRYPKGLFLLDKLLVLVDARMARRRTSGAASYVRELRAEIEADPPADLEVVWLSGPPGLPQKNRLTSLGNLLLDLFWTHVCLPIIAWRRRASLIHATFNWAPAWAPCPTLVTLHDLAWERRPDDFPDGFRRYASVFAKRSARHARIVVTPSQATADDAIALYRVPHDRIRVVHHGVRPPSTVPDSREPMVLSVGVLHRRKRIPELIEGHRRYMESAPEDPPPCRLVVVGGPAGDEERVYEVAGPDCEILGFVSRERLDDLYRRASLFVYPSALEGFGMPVAEAMANGCPVLVARNSSLTEVAGEAGLYLDDASPDGIAQALEAALADRETLARRGDRAREAALLMTWSEAARQTLSAYRAALAR
jgi:glycosyltransferase involved in cell wall biosynthesis